MFWTPGHSESNFFRNYVTVVREAKEFVAKWKMRNRKFKNCLEEIQNDDINKTNIKEILKSGGIEEFITI